jgi:hypothetical protein
MLVGVLVGWKQVYQEAVGEGAVFIIVACLGEQHNNYNNSETTTSSLDKHRNSQIRPRTRDDVVQNFVPTSKPRDFLISVFNHQTDDGQQ